MGIFNMYYITNSLMFKVLLLLGLFSISGNAMTDYQKSKLRQCYERGKPYDLGNTLAGICWVESKGGLYKINSKSNDYGLTQININNLLGRLNVEPTYINKSYYATILVEKDDYAIDVAIVELQYWKLDRKRTGWHHMVNSYNQGNKITNGNYAIKVAKAIKMLKKKGILK